MAESNGQDVRVPWFSGLCLEGDVAGQYEIDRSGSQQEGQETMKAGVLELDGLAPITIFVGANNSGKSRLLRELFKAKQPLMIKLKSRDPEGVEVDVGKEIPGWIIRMGGQVDRALKNSWIVETERRDLGNHLGILDGIILGISSPSEIINLRELKRIMTGCGITGGIRGLQEVKRLCVPILRGMRPPIGRGHK